MLTVHLIAQSIGQGQYRPGTLSTISGFRDFFNLYIENYPLTACSLEKFFSIKGDHFKGLYKDHLSGFREWEESREMERLS